MQCCMHGIAWYCMTTSQALLLRTAQVKEIIYPLGATIDVRAISLGDDTMSVLEIWGAEYQVRI